MTRQVLFVIALIFLAAFSRLIPHPYNFTAVGAMALFGGAVLKPRALALLIPYVAMFMTDFIIGFHDNMIAVNLAFGIVAIVGMTVVKKRSIGRIIGGSLLGSLLFFLITNFAVWLGDPTYPQTISGLIACYAMALPFYESSIFGNLALNSVMGDLFYSGILFTALYWVESRMPDLIHQKV